MYCRERRWLARKSCFCFLAAVPHNCKKKTRYCRPFWRGSKHGVCVVQSYSCFHCYLQQNQMKPSRDKPHDIIAGAGPAAGWGQARHLCSGLTRRLLSMLARLASFPAISARSGGFLRSPLAWLRGFLAFSARSAGLAGNMIIHYGQIIVFSSWRCFKPDGCWQGLFRA